MTKSMFTKFLSAKKFLLVTASALITGLSYAQPANDACSGALTVTPSTTATCNLLSSSTATSTMSTTVLPVSVYRQVMSGIVLLPV